MDPLSITTAIITLASLAASTGLAFKELRDLCTSLPGRLHALSNEVADFELVLYQVAALFEKRAYDPILNDQQARIPQLIKQATSKLQQLNSIIQVLIQNCRTAKFPIFRAHAWRKNQPRLQALQEDIKIIRCNLNIMLGASNSEDMMRIRVDLNSISNINSASTRAQAQMHDSLQSRFDRHESNIANSLADHSQQVERRIGHVEELLKTQAAQIQASQFNQMGNAYDRQSHSRRPARTVGKTNQHPELENVDAVGVRVSQFGACRSGCLCACHIQARTATPGLVDRVLGQIFVGYAGLPLLSPTCNMDSCEKYQTAQVSVEYWFPLGFVWSKIIRFELTYQPNVGPHLELSTLRRVPDSAQCVNFALSGNIDGLKDLFKRGLASPRDVSTTRGYSVMRWAMYGKQFQTCKFLLNAGADPDYRPIAASDNSPRNKAHQFLLMGGLPDEDVEALRCITQGSDFIDEQNYTTLHRIVLGLSLLDLEEQLRLHPEEINKTDTMGRTPLAWAACRGDERSIVTLLSYGANVNTIDIQHSGVVGHAADRNFATCVRLLLEAGADPDIAAKHGHKVGNPLNVAARNASDPLVLKTLLDFGADIESSGVDGMTALIHASRRDIVSFATLLLEYGAHINAMSTAGQTPLTTTIAYNSHSVLQLLLDRWFEYSECPRLRGPHLLQVVALYADVETMAILTRADHLLLKYDSTYVMGDFTSRLDQRPDATEKLTLAFEELLSVISQGPEAAGNHGSESLAKSGLMPEGNDLEHSGQVLANAMENFNLGKESEELRARPSICLLKRQTF